MDSFELNKLIGALLGVVFVVFSVSILSDSIFSTHAPETPGYAIAVPEETGGGAAVAEETGPSIIDLLQTADAAAGQAAFRPCAACHNVAEGGPNMAGPNLWDIVNRPIASHEGFNYSAAMREFAQGGEVVWDYEHLSGFLRAPRSYIPGTAMAYAGMRNPEQEANVIAYLRSLSNDPAPLPEPVAEEAAPAEGDEGATDEAAPVENDEGAADEAAPAADETAEPETEAEPAAPTTEDDGTSASPETDAGTASPAAPEASGEETAPAQQ